MLDDAELHAHIHRMRTLGSDDGRVEAKAAVRALPKGVWESVSAFANTSGGVVLLGLDESKGFTPAEGFAAGPIIDAVAAGLTGKDPKVAPVPPHQLEQHVVEGHPVVSLTVHPLLGGGPCFVVNQGVLNGSYRRLDDRDTHLTPYETYLLQSRDTHVHLDREPVDEATVQDIDPDQATRVIARLEGQHSRVLSGVRAYEDRLRRLNVVDREGRPTLAGVLSLGHYPQQFFPNLFVDVTVHPGTEKADTTFPERFLDRVVCEGPVPAMVQQAVAAVLRNLRVKRVVRGTSGIDVPEIPEDVLRETIVNAVIHRDYSPQAVGQQVTVDVYPDRVTVTNPGGFWGGVSPETIFDGVSTSRNDTLAKMLMNVPLPDGGTVVENQGSGVALMVNTMRDHGLPIPEFEATISQVTVTLSRFGLLTDDTSRWLQDIAGGQELETHERIALVLAFTHGTVAPKEMRAQVGMDTDDARTLLDRLTATGLLQRMGDDRYTLPTAPGTSPMRGQEDVPDGLTAAEVDVLESIGETPVSIHEVSRSTGRSVGALRPILRQLVAAGAIVPTAPPTSRRRAYLRTPAPGAAPPP